MSSINLVILGYLMHGEKSAYEMVKEFESWNLNRWIKISSPSVYKNIIKLSEQGYLDSRIVKEGEMPEKTIYNINDSGREYFHQLMKEAATNQERIYFDFSAFIINIGLLEKEEQKALLSAFSNKFEIASKKISEVSQMHVDKPKDARILIEFYERVFEFINNWSSYVANTYDQNES